MTKTTKSKVKKLTPPDKTRCQAEIGGAFICGGTCGGKRERCGAPPTVIVIEKNANFDGLKGGMSLCDSCLSVFQNMLGNDYANVYPVNEYNEKLFKQNPFDGLKLTKKIQRVCEERWSSPCQDAFQYIITENITNFRKMMQKGDLSPSNLVFVAEAINATGNFSLVEEFIPNLMKNDSTLVREAALYVAENFIDKNLIAMVIDMAKNDVNHDLRAAANEILL